MTTLTEAELAATDKIFPVFDILERLYDTGHTIKRSDSSGPAQPDSDWWLFDARGEGITYGQTFRKLCVNIILAGL